MQILKYSQTSRIKLESTEKSSVKSKDTQWLLSHTFLTTQAQEEKKSQGQCKYIFRYVKIKTLLIKTKGIA